jgi:hypothetical protein
MTTLLVACGGSSNSDFNVPQRGVELRVTHASPDAPAVNVYVDGALALENVEFKQSSGLIAFDEPGSVDVEVRGILPDGSEVSVIGPVALSLARGERTDVIAVGKLFDASGGINIAAQVLGPVGVDSNSDEVRVSVLHAAPDAGAVDIYVTAPGDELSSVVPIKAAYGDSAGPLGLDAAAEYRVRITPDGSSSVVFDSGALNFQAGDDILLTAVENTYKVGRSPVTLLAVGPDGASELRDVETGAAVRVVHNSADTPAVDVWVNGAQAIDALTFPNATLYDDLQAPAGTYNVVVAADADSSIAPINLDLTLEATRSYTVLAVGSLIDGTLAPVLTVDDRRSIATEARVEVVHGSYRVASQIPVDVYLTTDGVIADVDAAVSGLAYGESTGQIPLSPGDYWVTVTAAGDKSVVAFDSGGTLALAGGVNYTVVARDPSVAEGAGNPLIKLTLLSD